VSVLRTALGDGYAVIGHPVRVYRCAGRSEIEAVPRYESDVVSQLLDRLPRIRRRDTDERIISRHELQTALLPALPARHRALVATAAGTGLRWGEVAGLRRDALDLDGRALVVLRTVIEVSGSTSFKAFPKSSAGRRTVPLPSWLVPIVWQHLEEWPADSIGPVFANEVGGPLRRTMFRSRIWRPALVRAGLLGRVVADGDRHRAEWTDAGGTSHTERAATEAAAVKLVAKNQAEGLRFHDLRHSYATWLEMSGIASDASFDEISERILPATSSIRIDHGRG